MTVQLAPPGSADATSPAYRWRWLALLVVLSAEVMDLLDALVTSIAGPTITDELGGGGVTIQWLSAGYTLAMAAGLLIGGRLGDMFGRKRMFLIGMAGFTLFSLLCAAAQDPTMLITSRALQGLLGATLLPQGLGIINEMFPPAERAKAFGAFGPIMGIGAVGGPILAGWLIDADLLGLGWRAIFAINIPIGIIGIVGAVRYLPKNRPDRSLGLDVSGVILAAAGMFLLVYPLVQGREHDWPLWCFVMFTAGLLAFVAFAFLERSRDRAGRSTLVVPSLFTKRAFTGGLITGLAFFSALMGSSLVLTLYLQLGLHYTPLQAGLTAIPQAVAMIVGFGIGQPLTARIGRTTMHLGYLVVIAGLGVLVATISWSGASIDALRLAPALTLIGTGMGMAMTPFFDIVMSGVEDQESGSASGSMTAVQQIGSALGVAVLGTVFFGQVDGHGASVADSFGHATQITTWVAIGAMVVAFALTFLLPRRARDDLPATH
ncbi:putative actinorhodin transporter [Flexivirga endophytica]|uniref:Actinorhodin transporter n=1 Tax=Flexivirga endophytica TaxID=1849103 RepID=A0A916TFX4_9MICO|nr:MFS transporter [Flexivirga endophytica]GGB42132.1 putative actinorhodin transporter [Flexivirga endophytica]GHB69206.1 putative actinorhodin transporter [Flexivirga endophytica]